MRRTFGALLAAGGLALLLVIGLSSSAGAGNASVSQDPYTSTTPSTAPPTTPPPPVSVERVRQTRDTGSTLPVTGSDVMGLTLLGVGVLAVGGGLVWYSRRSQATPGDASS